MRTLGVLTGGGDCPGLNAVIRAIVLTAEREGIRVQGIRNVFSGLIHNQFTELNSSKADHLLQFGGTILGSSNRENPFYLEEHASHRVCRRLQLHEKKRLSRENDWMKPSAVKRILKSPILKCLFPPPTRRFHLPRRYGGYAVNYFELRALRANCATYYFTNRKGEPQ